MSKSLYSIFDGVQKKLRNFSDEKILAKSSVLISSTLESVNSLNGLDKHYDLRLIIKDRSRNNLLRLSILSYYVEKNLGYYLRTSILDLCQNRIELQDIKFILMSEKNKNLWLKDYIETHSGNQVFGNFLDKNEWLRTFNSFSVKRVRNHKLSSDRLPEKRSIGVGYRDKGTLPNSTSPGSLSQLSLTSVQNRIEENRQAAEDLYDIIKGFFY